MRSRNLELSDARHFGIMATAILQ